MDRLLFGSRLAQWLGALRARPLAMECRGGAAPSGESSRAHLHPPGLVRNAGRP